MTWLVKGDAREYGGMSGSVTYPDLDPCILFKMQVTDQIDFPAQTRSVYFRSMSIVIKKKGKLFLNYKNKIYPVILFQYIFVLLLYCNFPICFN